MWVCVYVYIHTVEEQIKKLLHQFKDQIIAENYPYSTVFNWHFNHCFGMKYVLG